MVYTISGAGPSVIAFSENSFDLKKISAAMSKDSKLQILNVKQ